MDGSDWELTAQTPGDKDAETLGLHIDRVNHEDPSIPIELESVTQANRRLVNAMRSLQDTYASILPAASLVGLLGILAALSTRQLRRRYGLLVVVAAACLLAVLSRAVLTALIEVVGWPGAMASGYLDTANPFLVSFAGIGLVLLALVIRDFLRPRLRIPSKA